MTLTFSVCGKITPCSLDEGLNFWFRGGVVCVCVCVCVRYARTVEEDCVVNGQFLPKGATLEIPAGFLHYDPEHWPEPEKFIPERCVGVRVCIHVCVCVCVCVYVLCCVCAV